MCSGSVAGHSLSSDWEEDVCGEIVLWSMCHCAAVTREKITAKTEPDSLSLSSAKQIQVSVIWFMNGSNPVQFNPSNLKMSLTIFLNT